MTGGLLLLLLSLLLLLLLQPVLVLLLLEIRIGTGSRTGELSSTTVAGDSDSFRFSEIETAYKNKQK